jgi:hypothetical protein
VAGSAQPAQPPLVVGLVNGILVFCGLVVAGCMTLAASDAFEHAPGWLRCAIGVTLVLAVIGGAVANFGVVQAVNLARRIELGKPNAASARYWSMAATNVALVASACSGVGAIVAMFGFLTLPAQPEAKAAAPIDCAVRQTQATSMPVEAVALASSHGCVVTISAAPRPGASRPPHLGRGARRPHLRWMHGRKRPR